MVLRLASSTPSHPSTPSDPWQLFSLSQQTAAVPSTAPRIVVTQPAHAALAGRLARALSPGPFGVLPPEVSEIIGDHDAGWAAPDLAALEAAAELAQEGTVEPCQSTSLTLRSFLELTPSEAIPAWRESIRLATQRSPLAGVLTSRHFCLLADDGDPEHQAFRDEELTRRKPAEAALPLPPADLDRFTAALGFCDLLSLFLAGGIAEHASFPLAHPADREAASAPHATLTRRESHVRSHEVATWSFDPPLLAAPTHLTAIAWQTTRHRLEAATLAWLLS